MQTPGCAEQEMASTFSILHAQMGSPLVSELIWLASALVSVVAEAPGSAVTFPSASQPLVNNFRNLGIVLYTTSCCLLGDVSLEVFIVTFQGGLGA